jgi:hypothetical protein
MIKFFGEPLKVITSKASGMPMFRFDTKGEFITDDPVIIERAMGFFDYIPMKAEVTGEKVEKTFTVLPLTITTKDDVKNEKVEKPIEKVLKCKKCDFTTDNQGVLMAHYREHKKEVE